MSQVRYWLLSTLHFVINLRNRPLQAPEGAQKWSHNGQMVGLLVGGAPEFGLYGAF